MLINSSTAIDSTHILLVPYEAKHVAIYHEWMKDEVRADDSRIICTDSFEEIQIATASEPLSLDEEYDMQRKWRHDADKLTFIICRPLQDSTIIKITEENENADNLVGDINLFLSVSEEDDVTVVGEIELMIAERSARRRGMGRASLLAFVGYINQHRQAILKEFHGGNADGKGDLGYLRVRVGSENHSSLRLFKSIGFELVSEKPNVFGEVELRTAKDLQAFLDRAFERHPMPAYRELEYRRNNTS